MNFVEIISFQLGYEEFGIEINQVREIIRMVEIAEVPRSPDFVEGVINVRGDIVPLLSLRKIFEMGVKEYKANTQIIITETKKETVGLIVDKVSEILLVEKKSIQPPLDTIPLEEFLLGVIKLEDKLLFLLSLDKIISLEKKAILEKVRKISHLSKISRWDKKKSSLKAILHKRAIDLSKTGEKEKIEKKELVIFSLGREWYGLDMSKVERILKLDKIAVIPCVPDYIEGAINLKGEVISVIDLKKIFGLPEKTQNKKRYILLVKQEEIKICFLIESIFDIIDLPTSLIQPPLTTIEKVKANYIIGEAQFDNKLLTVLNLKSIINFIIEKELSL